MTAIFCPLLFHPEKIASSHFSRSGPQALPGKNNVTRFLCIFPRKWQKGAPSPAHAFFDCNQAEVDSAKRLCKRKCGTAVLPSAPKNTMTAFFSVPFSALRKNSGHRNFDRSAPNGSSPKIVSPQFLAFPSVFPPRLSDAFRQNAPEKFPPAPRNAKKRLNYFRGNGGRRIFPRK